MKPKDTIVINAEATNITPLQDEATALIAQAIEKNVPVETMEKLLAMRRELKQERAKEEYNRAMAAFQAECPTIQKTKEVKTRAGIVAYRYAPIESIVDQVKDALKNNGFSYSTNMELLESGVKVCVKVTHAAGHSEETCMTVPLGNKTEIMSQTQVVAAAQTFAKRYAFCNAFGILTGDEDNDGDTKSISSHTEEKPLPTPPSPAPKRESILPITADQKGDLMILLPKLNKTQLDLNKFVKKHYNLDSYQLLTKVQAEAVIRFLEKQIAKKDEAELDKQPVGNFESPDDVPGVNTPLTDEQADEIAEAFEQQRMEE